MSRKKKEREGGKRLKEQKRERSSEGTCRQSQSQSQSRSGPAGGQGKVEGRVGPVGEQSVSQSGVSCRVVSWIHTYIRMYIMHPSIHSSTHPYVRGTKINCACSWRGPLAADAGWASAACAPPTDAL